jgi:mannosyltransferase OCH1-like enzyme
MRLWTEENLPDDFVRKEAYERLRKPAERCDIILIEVLARFGGVYADTDFECLRPIDPLLEGTDFFAGYSKSGKVNSGLIGASPGHPILERAITELRPVTQYGLDKWGTGALFLDKRIRQYPEVTIFPREYFYPATPAERDSAYLIHHDAFSWKEPEDWREAFFKAERKLDEARERIAELERRRLRNRVSRLVAPFRRQDHGARLVV